jgi:hypothetical protein
MSKCPVYAVHCRPQRAGIQPVRDDRWSDAMAFGSLAFVEKIKSDLGTMATHRAVERAGATSVLRERSEVYGGQFASENNALRAENTIEWQTLADFTETVCGPTPHLLLQLHFGYKFLDKQLE